MIYASTGITVLWLFSSCYITIASIDFGADFSALHPKLAGNEKETNHLISHYLNPVWEVMSIFFILSFVGFTGSFSGSIKHLDTALLIPDSTALIMISLRDSLYASENHGQDTRLVWMTMYGVSELLIPASLSTALAIIEGGYINARSNVIDLNWV